MKYEEFIDICGPDVSAVPKAQESKLYYPNVVVQAAIVRAQLHEHAQSFERHVIGGAETLEKRDLS